MSDRAFKEIIWKHYRRNRRLFSWRERITPYRVFVSEVMLQQTQVSRVERFFPKFIKSFPSFRALAAAPASRVLEAWHGLGYNRRALNLKRSAEIIAKNFKGRLPQNREALEALPGIGPNTAGSILAFAFNLPVPFIETNIRRAYLHHYFPEKQSVSDRELLAIIERTLDKKNPRAWYFALMDYGSELPRKVKHNPNIRSRHYTKQPAFTGSKRELRGKVLALALKQQKISAAAVARELGISPALAAAIAATLAREGFFTFVRGTIKVE